MALLRIELHFVSATLLPSWGIKRLDWELQMKIKEEIKKSGTFWLPPYREKMPGILSISNEKGIELEVAQSFVSDPASIVSLFNNPYNLFRIAGHIQEFGFVILDGCQTPTSGFNFNYGLIQTSRVIRADRVFTGFPSLQTEIPSFNTFKFSIEGIDEWVGIRGINVKFEPEERTTTISSKPPETISFNLTKGMRLEITFIMGRPESHSLWEIGVSQKAYFKLVSEDPKELNEFFDVVRKIVGLLCFTINETVSLDSMLVTSDELLQDIGGGETRPAPIDIYDPSVFLPKDRPKIRADKMLFRFSDIQDGAEGMINKWIENYEEYKDAFNLYFLAQLKPPLSWSVKFMSLVQGLEAYHRTKSDEKYMEDDEFKVERKKVIKQFPKKDRNWFGAKLNYANELTLRHRIKKLIVPFEKYIGGDREPRLIDYIVDTRNYLTHYDSKSESKAAKGEDLYNLGIKLELLFELHFLDLMGFSQDEIDSIVANNPILQWKGSLTLSDAETENETSSQSEDSEEQED